MSGATVPDIMIGGLVGWSDLGTIANVQSLLDTGRVGLYIHEQILNPAYNNGNGFNFSNPILNSEVTSVFGQTIGVTGPVEYEGHFSPDTAPYWDATAPTLNENYPYAALPAANLPEPDAADVNLGNWDLNTAEDHYNFWNSPTIQQAWTSYVDAAMANGIATVAPIITPDGYNGATFGWDPTFTDPAYDGARKMAAYGHAIALDAPPNYYNELKIVNPAVAEEYLNFVEQEINWANSSNVRSELIVARYDDDSTYVDDVKNFVQRLVADGAIPAKYIVENYDPTTSTLAIGSDTDPNSLAGAALWLAQNAPTYGHAAPPGSKSPPDPPKGTTQSDPPAPNTQPSPPAGNTSPNPPVGNAPQNPAAPPNHADSVAGGSNLIFTAAEAAEKSTVYTGNGNDTIVQGLGDTTIWAGSGHQTAFGSGNADASTTVFGNIGSLEFIGGAAAESISLANGPATVFGGLSDQNIKLGSASAVVVTGAGSTNISLQMGTITVFELGGGVVTYDFTPNLLSRQAADFISGFTVGRDTLNVSSFGSDTAASLIAGQQHFGGGTLLTLPDGTRLVLANIGVVDGRFFS